MEDLEASVDLILEFEGRDDFDGSLMPLVHDFDAFRRE